jgi:glyoxylase-like metal-dependent hydrolase (beta-lactamase superfamily II)
VAVNAVTLHRAISSAAPGHPRWLLTLALACVLTAAGCERKPALADRPLQISVHTASEEAGMSNSVLLSAEHEALLVDAQLTKAEAAKLAELIRASGKAVHTVFITHGHPDHYFGASVLKAAFPGLKFVAIPAVVEFIRQSQSAIHERVKARLGDAISDDLIVPEPLEGDVLTLEGRTIKVLPLGAGESPAAAVLYLPMNKALVAGDLAYHGVHPWLAEGRVDGWLMDLEGVRHLGEIDTVIPGHGAPGGREILAQTANYLRTFAMVTDRAATPEAAKAELLQLFPDYRVPFYLDRALQARYAKRTN